MLSQLNSKYTNMQAILKSLSMQLYGIRVESIVPDAPVAFTTITSGKKDTLQLELESIGVKLFLSKVKTFKLSYSQILNGVIALKRDQMQYALDFFRSAAQFAMDSFISSTSFSDKVLAMKMRLLSFMFIHKNITIGEFHTESWLHSECTNSLDALIALPEVQKAILSELEASGSFFSFACPMKDNFKSSGGKVLVEVSSLLHWVERFAAGLAYKIPVTASNSSGNSSSNSDGSETAQRSVILNSLHTKLRGHRNRVTATATHSQYFLSGSKDKHIKVWDIETLALKATLKGHSNAISCLAVMGDHLYSGSGDGTVRLWHLRTMRCIAVSRAVPLAFDYSVRSLAVDAASRNVFVGCSDGVIRVLDPLTLVVRGTMKGHRQWVTSLVVHEGVLYSGSMDTTIKVWDVASLTCINCLSGHTSFVSSLVVAGGHLLSGSHDKTLRVWDLATLCEVTPVAGAEEQEEQEEGGFPRRDAVVRSLAVSHNKVYVGYADDHVAVLDATTLRVVSEVRVKETSFDDCLAVADGKMFVGSAGKTVVVHLL